MKQRDAILTAYNKTASQYADQFFNELAGKSLDRILLKRFAAENTTKGPLLDLACGPGQTTRFLYEEGVKDLLGVDLSPRMAEVATAINNNKIKFESGDMLQLDYKDNHFGSVVCFYGIVHFLESELALAFKEIHRVISPGGHFLFSFHIGQEITTLDEFLGQPVAMSFYYFEVEKVLAILKEIGWKKVETLERHPYEGKEYPSRRAYITMEK